MPRTCATCMPRGYGRVAAARGGVPVYAGTDAGSTIEHGRIADGVAALQRIGMTAHRALGWRARMLDDWLGRPGMTSADLLCYAQDRGRVRCAAASRSGDFARLGLLG